MWSFISLFFKKNLFFFFFFIFFNKPFVVLEFSSYHTLVLLFFVYTLSNIIFISSNWVDNVTVSCYLSLDNWYYMLINPSLSYSCFIPLVCIWLFLYDVIGRSLEMGLPHDIWKKLLENPHSKKKWGDNAFGKVRKQFEKFKIYLCFGKSGWKLTL